MSIFVAHSFSNQIFSDNYFKSIFFISEGLVLIVIHFTKSKFLLNILKKESKNGLSNRSEPPLTPLEK